LATHVKRSPSMIDSRTSSPDSLARRSSSGSAMSTMPELLRKPRPIDASLAVSM
jgi:hypothetical protein